LWGRFDLEWRRTQPLKSANARFTGVEKSRMWRTPAELATRADQERLARSTKSDHVRDTMRLKGSSMIDQMDEMVVALNQVTAK
jgi:hypothetical protein